MYLFEVKVTDLNSDREVSSTSMIADTEWIQKDSVLEIMEKLADFTVEFSRKKKARI